MTLQTLLDNEKILEVNPSNVIHPERFKLVEDIVTKKGLVKPTGGNNIYLSAEEFAREQPALLEYFINYLNLTRSQRNALHIEASEIRVHEGYQIVLAYLTRETYIGYQWHIYLLDRKSNCLEVACISMDNNIVISVEHLDTCSIHDSKIQYTTVESRKYDDGEEDNYQDYEDAY